jgi:hypothetical protein
MPQKVPNIQRIINNDILKIVNIVFYGGGAAAPLASTLCTALTRTDACMSAILQFSGFPKLKKCFNPLQIERRTASSGVLFISNIEI